MKPRIFCAIDKAELDPALALVRQLSSLPLHFKLGLEFFIALGISGVGKVRDAAGADVEIFLDLKFHDIPNTVAGAVRAALPARPQFITVHASGGSAMIQAAVEAARASAHPPKILAVTVLTHLADGDLAAAGIAGNAQEQVLRLARLAQEAGADGAVCSPLEAALLRRELGRDFLLVVPGIRTAGAPADDQKRTMTPQEALKAGADYLVVGRPITAATDPFLAAKMLLNS